MSRGMGAALKDAGHQTRSDQLLIIARVVIEDAKWDHRAAVAAMITELDPEGLVQELLGDIFERAVKAFLQGIAAKMRAEQAPKNAVPDRSGAAAAGAGHRGVDTQSGSARPAALHAPNLPRAPMAGLSLIARSVLDTLMVNGIALGDMSVAEGWASATHLRGRAKADNHKAKLIELMLSGLPPDGKAIRDLLTPEEAEKRAKLAEADDNA